MSDTPLFLVDGHNLLWIATMGSPATITSRDRTRTLTGVFMFFAVLRKAIRENLPTAPEVLVVFDGEHGNAERKQADAGYKAHRPTDIPEPIHHLPNVQRGLDAIGIPWIEVDDAEADDVIASATAYADGRDCYIYSRDRDFFQLVSNTVRILNTAKPAGARIIGPADVFQRYHVTPRQWCDRTALVGDPADGLPGVRGIGPKTAARLLADNLTLDDLRQSSRLTGRLRQAILDQWERVLTWREIIRMRTTVTLPTPPIGTSTPEIPAAPEILERLHLW